MKIIFSGYASLIRVLALCVLLSGYWQQTQAEEPVPAEEIPAVLLDVTAPAADPKLQQDSENYRNEIERLEKSGGVYDNKLGENLLGLGIVYQQQGKHKEAVEALNRAMQIHRVNEGLQNLNQLAVLENIMTSNAAIGDWEELDHNYQQMLWLHRRNFDPDAPEYIRNLVRHGRWKVDAFRNARLGKGSFSALQEAQALYSRIIRHIEKQHGKLDPRLVELHYLNAMINFELLLDAANRPLSEFDTKMLANNSMPEVVYERICYRTTTGALICDMVPRVTYQRQINSALDAQQQKDNLMRNYGSQVTRSLEQIFKIADNSQSQIDEKHIRNLVNAADWRLPNDIAFKRQEKNKGGRLVLERLGLKKAQLDVMFGKTDPEKKDGAEKEIDQNKEQDL
ncbi:MAG: tetratricopeptide repeat protein [Gammaproteobacteria bacterium]|jgi:tetratricopeptide (TPR) repeat protein|nr:MAG: tetratricopeptide repeat protein [Gammaproteobacteria bacterium]